MYQGVWEIEVTPSDDDDDGLSNIVDRGVDIDGIRSFIV